MDIRMLAEVLSLYKDEEKNNLSIDLFEKEIKQISFMEKHKKASKPYCPKNIINKNFNSKKKGGR